jgi:hypothetical protein
LEADANAIDCNSARGRKPRSPGHTRPRGPGSWELKFDADRNPTTGGRKTKYVTFKGTKREAQVELARLIAAVGDATMSSRAS